MAGDLSDFTSSIFSPPCTNCGLEMREHNLLLFNKIQTHFTSPTKSKTLNQSVQTLHTLNGVVLIRTRWTLVGFLVLEVCFLVHHLHISCGLNATCMYILFFFNKLMLSAQTWKIILCERYKLVVVVVVVVVVCVCVYVCMYVCMS
jgi:hypothetical protein